MSELIQATAPLSRPYIYKKSRLTVTTKVYTKRYICDLKSIGLLLDRVSEKLLEKSKVEDQEFNFLISFTDNTHSDGEIKNILNESNLDTDKKTERIVMNWKIAYYEDNNLNELEITVRISNPINPLAFLQAALSKNPNEIDNIEYELGSTCVTVEGADQAYAEEVFLRVSSWLDARTKPYKSLDISGFYKKYEWILDQSIISLMPIFLTAIISFYFSKNIDDKTQLALVPVFVASFFVLKSIGAKIVNRMTIWARRADFIGLFSITQGDKDYMSEMLSKAQNGSIKVAATLILSILINIGSGIMCWYLIQMFLDRN